jgi:hypothetical protein
MARLRHYQRLEQMYSASPAAMENPSVAVSYGRAELRGDAAPDAHPRLAAGMPHQQLLTDVASLAAASIEKEHVVSAEQFQVEVVDGEYRGPLVASAEILFAQPPRSVVRAVLRSPDGEVVAHGTGVFHPTSVDLPDDLPIDLDEVDSADEGGASPSNSRREESSDRSAPRPAAFMPVHPTPFGPLCLN